MHRPMDEVRKEAAGVADLQCDVGEDEEWGFGCMRVRGDSVYFFIYSCGGRMPSFVEGRREERRVLFEYNRLSLKLEGVMSDIGKLSGRFSDNHGTIARR